MDLDPHRDREEVQESRENAGPLVALAFGPSLWALHFLTVYIAGAIACERAPGAMEAVRIGIGVATAVALIAIVLVTVPAWRAWRTGREVSQGDGSPRGRSRFLGAAALLLSGLSLVAVGFSALPALLAGTCT